jgi:hypothetical protein
MADHDDSKQPAAPPAPPHRGLNVGDAVIIHAKVIRLEENGALTVTVGPLEMPGHEAGYSQIVTLYDAGLAERV